MYKRGDCKKKRTADSVLRAQAVLPYPYPVAAAACGRNDAADAGDFGEGRRLDLCEDGVDSAAQGVCAPPPEAAGECGGGFKLHPDPAVCA